MIIIVWSAYHRCFSFFLHFFSVLICIEFLFVQNVWFIIFSQHFERWLHCSIILNFRCACKVERFKLFEKNFWHRIFHLAKSMPSLASNFTILNIFISISSIRSFIKNAQRFFPMLFRAWHILLPSSQQFLNSVAYLRYAKFLELLLSILALTLRCLSIFCFLNGEWTDEQTKTLYFSFFYISVRQKIHDFG